MFNYTSNWEYKVILDISYDRLPIWVLFGIPYAQLCPTWADDCCGLVTSVQWGVCGVQLCAPLTAGVLCILHTQRKAVL